jgi:hypothetical protein
MPRIGAEVDAAVVATAEAGRADAATLHAAGVIGAGRGAIAAMPVGCLQIHAGAVAVALPGGTGGSATPLAADHVRGAGGTTSPTVTRIAPQRDAFAIARAQRWGTAAVATDALLAGDARLLTAAAVVGIGRQVGARSVAALQPGRASWRAEPERADLGAGAGKAAGAAVLGILAQLGASVAAHHLIGTAHGHHCGVWRDDGVDVERPAGPGRGHACPDSQPGRDAASEPAHYGSTSKPRAISTKGCPNEATSCPAIRTTGSGRRSAATTSIRAATIGWKR